MRTLLFSMLFILSPLLGYAADMAQPSPIADKKEKDKEAFVRKAGHQLELSGSLCEKWEVDPGNARKSICVKKLKVTSSTKTQNITWLTDDFHDYIAYITKENRIALDLLELKKLKISAKIDEKMAFHLFTSYLDIYFKFSKINELIQNHISAQRANPSVKQGNLDQDILREIISVLENPIGRSVQDIQAELEKFEKTTDPSARSDLYIKYSDIFEMIVIRNIERVVLESVLTQYELFKKGQIAERDAVKQGIKFVNKKYKLPNGFLDENRADDFIKNKGKNYEEEDDTF